MADKTTYTGEIAERASNAKQAVSEAVHEAKDRMNQVGGVIVEKVEETRDAAAEAAHSASESLHTSARNLPGADTAAGLANSAADRLDSAAGYLAEHDTREMLADAGSFVRRNPGKSLLAAAALGFLVGRRLYRD